MERYMLDTTVYNHMLNRKLRFSDLEEAEYYCTQIQITELDNTQNIERKIQLLNVKNETKSEKIHLETFVIGISQFDCAKLGPGKEFTYILETMDEIKKGANNLKDSLIAETAFRNGMTLITGDMTLYKACNRLGIPVKTLDEIAIKK